MSLYREVKNDTLYLSDSKGEVLSMTETQSVGVDIALRGELRSDAVHDFQDELISLAILGLDLRLDFSGVTYLSSACMASLLAVQQKMDERGRGSLTLCRLPPAIYEEFVKTGSSELLMIEE